MEEIKLYRMASMPGANCKVAIKFEDGVPTEIALISYTTTVVVLKKNGDKYSMECSGTYSQTTRRHINRFTKEFTGENMYYSCRDAVSRGDVFVDWIPAKSVIDQANRYKQYGKISRN